MQTVTSDYVIVGSGPGGATVARDLARAGKEVIHGPHEHPLGNDKGQGEHKHGDDLQLRL